MGTILDIGLRILYPEMMEKIHFYAKFPSLLLED